MIWKRSNGGSLTRCRKRADLLLSRRELYAYARKLPEDPVLRADTFPVHVDVAESL
jgi:hypothetical protein